VICLAGPAYAEQAGDPDVADGMEGDEEHATNEHQGDEGARPFDVAAK
jgi:hypothetical protein